MAQAAPAARAPKVDAQRRGLYATVAIACKDLGIDDQSRRDMIAAQCGGKTSMKACSIAELEDLVDHLKRQGFKPKHRGGRAPNRTGPGRAGARALADAPEARKARALWISLYHLGVVRSPKESALAKFGERQTGKAALQWIKGDWHKVIEALKQMAEREAAVDWGKLLYQVIDPETGKAFEAVGNHPRLSVIYAQWKIAKRLGAVIDDPHVAVEGFGRGVTGKSAFQFYDDADFDRLIEALGGKIRKAQKTAPAEGDGS
ncbi:MAG: regulatory protein GemA [Marivibrio sp.]|uniref:regulatory protein GemA n=1 Tax=Marivibrio sp. TaxID=2039719 RepID=UPI0032EC2087